MSVLNFPSISHELWPDSILIESSENTYIAGGLEHRVRLYQWSYLGLLFLAIDYDKKLLILDKMFGNSTLAVVTVRRTRFILVPLTRSTGAIAVVEPRT